MRILEEEEEEEEEKCPRPSEEGEGGRLKGRRRRMQRRTGRWAVQGEQQGRRRGSLSSPGSAPTRWGASGADQRAGHWEEVGIADPIQVHSGPLWSHPSISVPEEEEEEESGHIPQQLLHRLSGGSTASSAPRGSHSTFFRCLGQSSPPSQAGDQICPDQIRPPCRLSSCLSAKKLMKTAAVAMMVAMPQQPLPQRLVLDGAVPSRTRR
jgi:hypothetical protein